MKYIDEFRNKKLIQRLAQDIFGIMPKSRVKLMEVCGTHTQNFRRFGLGELLPENLSLVSGPGCPVCVSAPGYIDAALRLARDKNNIILTFGDMLCVPGNKSSLIEARAEGNKISVVYSALGSLEVARKNPEKKVIFLAVGFETTAPTIALSILAAAKEKIRNLYFFSALKLIPPAMKYLLGDKRLQLDGFLCPGHVSAVIGAKAYAFIARQYKIPCCVTGFEPLDILEGIYLLLQQIVSGRPRVANQYLRAVKNAGNRQAQQMMARVFRVADDQWRGMGEIAQSGLKIKREFSGFDAEKAFGINSVTLSLSAVSQKCRCGEILKGLIAPQQCPLFGKACRPEHPLGPCMVSSEGTCNAHYRYR